MINNSKIDIEIISKIFPQFETELCKEISEVGEWVTAEDHETVFGSNNLLRTFPLVLEGWIKVSRVDEDGNELLLYYLTKGETCSIALTCCGDGQTSVIEAVADEGTEMLRIPVKYNEIWLDRFYSWKQFATTSNRDRFSKMISTIDSIAFQKMDDRLLQYLADHYNRTKTDHYAGTHQSIATDLNSTREVISRLLKKLEKIGRIKLSRNKITNIDII